MQNSAELHYFAKHMVTDESIKRHVLSWAGKVGTVVALRRLTKGGVGERMARYLVRGDYPHSITLKKADQIVRAMR